ncbi:hypothetical protein H6P81_000716 [Aristolochia fimbriata]|uniref:SCP domain-containing protein n=1 Tax=Aristolochia fimbriata TaxID=158543 RepID=A0AAV7F5G9_ARIFI|nr:hypothetical protein H6P81_000716 [Aristolochia fimbriata]
MATFLTTSLFLIIALLLASLVTTIDGAMNKTEMIQQFLDGHNRARKAVGVPPLVWEPLLATYARVYSNQRRHDCRLVHSPALVFGENIFWGQGRRWSAKDAVDAWVAEKRLQQN